MSPTLMPTVKSDAIRQRDDTPMKSKWFYQRLDDTDSKVNEFLTLGVRGVVVVANRVYDTDEAIDLEVGLLRFYRERRNRFLEVTAHGGDTYLFEFRQRLFAPGYWLRWVKQSVSPVGTLVEMPSPTINWKTSLYWDDLWEELEAFIFGSLSLWVVGAVVLAIVKALFSSLANLF